VRLVWDVYIKEENGDGTIHSGLTYSKACYVVDEWRFLFDKYRNMKAPTNRGTYDAIRRIERRCIGISMKPRIEWFKGTNYAPTARLF